MQATIITTLATATLVRENSPALSGLTQRPFEIVVVFVCDCFLPSVVVGFRFVAVFKKNCAFL